MNLRSFAFLAFISFNLLACSEYLKILVQNNSGVSIIVDTSDDKKELSNAATKKVLYPLGADGRYFILRKGRCRYNYWYPDVDKLNNYFRGNRLRPTHLRVQVEPDLKIYLIPPASNSIVEVELLSDMQEAGFPLEPASLDCD